jgi:hypothetical protein
VSQASVGQDRIDGTGGMALATLMVGPSDLAAPTFAANNIAGFTASLADVFLDEPTRHAVLVGLSGTVIDLGTHDRIIGFTAMGDQQHVVGQMHQAMELRNHAIRAARASAKADLSVAP